MLFVLDHYYAVNHQEFCLVVEIDKDVNEVVEICSAITFLLEELIDESVSLDMDCLLNILVSYYGAKDKKCDISGDILDEISMPIDSMYQKIALAHDGICVSYAYVVDLYEARESCCGPKYEVIMDKWLPKGEELEGIKELLRTTGVEK